MCTPFSSLWTAAIIWNKQMKGGAWECLAGVVLEHEGYCNVLEQINEGDYLTDLDWYCARACEVYCLSRPRVNFKMRFSLIELHNYWNYIWILSWVFQNKKLLNYNQCCVDNKNKSFNETSMIFGKVCILKSECSYHQCLASIKNP